MSILNMAVIVAVGAPVALVILAWLFGVRYIPHNRVGIVTVQDGLTIGSGEIIAPEVRPGEGQPDHNYFQDPEAFLALGGRRGKQLKELNEAQATAQKQTELTQTHIDVEVAANKGEAQLAEAQRLAKRDIARAEGESRSKELLGRGEAARIAQVGLSEAAVNLQKIRAYGDSRLFALNLVADQFAKSAQPIVPERLLIMGGGKDGEGRTDLGSVNLLSQLLGLLLAEKAGLGVTEKWQGLEALEKLTDELTQRFKQETVTSAGNGGKQNN